ncbi:MAG: TonB-dependent receptor [Bacteroidales bacterium]|nr:TonB-dependent receptor [Bacteroidales bacterium]
MRNAFKSLSLSLMALFAGVLAYAQVTTSSMSGRITDEAGPVVGAAVVAVHQPTGSQFYSITDAKGYYRLNNITAGGPYTVTVSCMGYADAVFTDISVALSDNLVLDTVLAEETLTLEGVVVSAEGRTSNMRSDRAGAITSLGARQIMEVPTISRSMNDLLKQTPQAFVDGNKVSIGGGNYRQSYVTVDGAAFNNAFGIGSNLPANGNPISLDALDQVAISVTPYDVRQSGFVGGGIATTTKSGTNKLTGTAYVFFRNQDMQGTEVGDQSFTLDPSRYLMYGASVGGPIVKDKLFFFLSVEADRSISPGPTRRLSQRIDNGSGTLVDNGEVFTTGNDGVARPSAVVLDAFHDYLLNNYGYEAGVYKGYSTESPGLKLLGRLDWNINRNHKLNLRVSRTQSKSANTMSGSLTGFADTGYAPKGGRTSMYSMYFKNARYYQENNFTSVAAELNSRFLDGALNNTLRATYSHQYDPRSQEGGYFPGVDIVVGEGSERAIYTVIGSETYTYGNLRDVHTALVTDELTYSAGIHNLLLGAQFEYNHTTNGYQTQGGGAYVFEYPTEQAFYSSILNGKVFDNPSQFAVTHGNNAELTQQYPTFEYEQISAYLQDQMNISNRFRLTAGVRFEMPIYPSIAYNKNPYVEAVSFAATTTNPSGVYDTAQLPKARLQVSPRVGFNWDILGNRKLVLRGGTGIFVGRLPFVWIVAQAGNSGVLQTSIARKAADGIPAIGNDRTAIIQGLYPGGYTPQIASNLPQLTLIDPAIKNPSSWKSSLALDAELPAGFNFSLEGVYSKDMNPSHVSNIGLRAPTSLEAVPDITARPYYNNGSYVNDMANVYLLRNVDNKALWGYYYSVTATLSKNLWKGFTGSLSYTYTDARSVNDGVGDQVSSTWKAFVTKRGTNSMELGIPNYVMPHRVMGNITWTKDYFKYFGTTISLYYYGGPRSRGSIDYVDNIYGDGAYQYSLIDIPTYNDLFGSNPWQFEAYNGYSAEQQKLDFWAYIQQDPYLSKHTGEVAERNGAVFPWVHQFDLKINQNFYFYTGSKHHKHTIQLGMDIQNFGNMLNPYWGNVWGLNASDGYGNSKPLNLTNPAKVYLEGARPVFRFVKNGTQTLDSSYYRVVGTGSTWSMMISARYIF